MRQEWEITMVEYFPTQKSSRKKSCPKNAFLGLCEEGLIADIPQGDYGVNPESLNKCYAVKAALLVFEGVIDKKMLWKTVSGDAKTHNSQIDIVLELNKAGLLKKKVSGQI